MSGSDNVIKPMLLRGSARIHPLMGFLSIIGGVLAFGVFGFLIGPVVLSLVLSAIRIYRLDVLRVASGADERFRRRRGGPIHHGVSGLAVVCRARALVIPSSRCRRDRPRP